MHTVTIVIPVYKDWKSLKLCLDSLIKYLDNRHQVLIVNDNGPDADVLESKITDCITGYDNFKYYRNSQNIGFVKTCNRAVYELDKTENDIFLLNSDTQVTPGFLDEMLECLYQFESCGVVCPRSNNATFLTIPVKNNINRTFSAEESYSIFCQLKETLPKCTVLLTGVGFAFLIKRSLLKEEYLFDEVFGLGYNEENDFCMRIRKKGYITLMANHAYVYHMEGVSFGKQKEKMELVNSSILLKRYPDYWKLAALYEKEFRSPVDYFADLLAEGIYPKKRIIFSIYDIKDKKRQEWALEIYDRFSIEYKNKFDCFLLVNKKQIKNISNRTNFLIVDIEKNIVPTFHVAYVLSEVSSVEHAVILNKIALQYVFIPDNCEDKLLALNRLINSVVYNQMMKFSKGIVCFSKQQAKRNRYMFVGKAEGLTEDKLIVIDKRNLLSGLGDILMDVSKNINITELDDRWRTLGMLERAELNSVNGYFKVKNGVKNYLYRNCIGVFVLWRRWKRNYLYLFKLFNFLK